jgi:hypothetical protein
MDSLSLQKYLIGIGLPVATVYGDGSVMMYGGATAEQMTDAQTIATAFLATGQIPTTNALAIAQLKAQLAALDATAVRPLRAVVAGTATDTDKARLMAMETQAQALRGQIQQLMAPGAS